MHGGRRFVDHRPEGPDTLRRHADTLTHTMDAIREAGYEPDQYLWGRSSGHLGFAPGCETSRSVHAAFARMDPG